MTKNGIPDPDQLRVAFDQSIGSRARQAVTAITRDNRNAEDGREDRIAPNDGTSYGRSANKETTRAMEYEHTNDRLHSDRTTSSGGTHRTGGSESDKGDLVDIATIMAALVALILVGTLLARIMAL